MVLQRADSIVRTMLSDTILALCRNTLSYEGEVCIEGLLGITVDQKEVFLVHLNETIQKEGFSPTKSLKRKTVDVPSKESGDDSQQSSQGSESESQDFSQTPTKRKRRRKRRSKDKPNFDKDGIEGNLDAYSDKLDISQEQKPCDIENDDADSHLSAEVKKEDSHSGEEELVFVKEEPSDVYEQSVFSLPGASQPAESSQLYQQNDPVPIGQLQELAFQLSGDISQTQHNIPQTPALSSQSAGGTTEQGTSTSTPGSDSSLHKAAQVHKVSEGRASEFAAAQKAIEQRAAYWKTMAGSQLSAESVSVRSVTEETLWKQSMGLDLSVNSPGGHVGRAVTDDAAALWKHMTSSQAASGDNLEKQFACTMCDKSYTSMTGLKRHLRMTHSGERPYKCEVCAMAFSQSTDLKRHFRIHTGEKPYVCRTCGKAFTQSGTLTVHMRTHAAEQTSLAYALDQSTVNHLKQ